MNIHEPMIHNPGRAVLEDRKAGPVALRMVVGAQLRRLREAHGITRNAAGKAIKASHSKISRLELGKTGFNEQDVADLLTLYGVDDENERARWLDVAKQTNAPGWWHEYGDVLTVGLAQYLGLEQAASAIRTYDAQFIPDLLCTASYTRSVMMLGHDTASAEQIERRVELQSKRQQILYGPRPAKLWAVLDEAALRRKPVDASTIRQQLDHLIQVSALPNITVQVMPSSAGQATSGSITMLRFREPILRDVVYLEKPTSTSRLERAADVLQYLQMMDRMCVQAEAPGVTATILCEILQEI